MTEAVASHGYPMSRRATVVALVGVLMGMTLAALSQTILGTAMPVIAADLGESDDYSWVFTAYMLVQSVSTPIFGRLSDIYGRRRFLIMGVVIFMLGSVAAGRSGSIEQLVAARAFQGLGAGSMVALAEATVADLVAPAERAMWQGITGALVAVGTVLGPILGGLIADSGHWPWVFYLALPIGLTMLVIVSLTLRIPPHPDRGTSVDYVGAALLALGLSSGLLAIVEGGAGLALLSVAGFAALIWWERRVEQPIIPIELFGLKVFRLAQVASLTVGAATFGTIMFLPLIMQSVIGVTATSSGLVLAPMMLATMFASIVSGQIIGRTGRYRAVMILGPAITAVGFIGLSGLREGSSVTHAIVAIVVVGVGIGLMQQNLVLVIQNAVPSRHLGSATGLSKVARSVGGSVGVALVAAALAGGGSGVLGSSERLAAGFRPVWIGAAVVMMLTAGLMTRMPELPLRGAVRDDVTRVQDPVVV